MQHVILILLSSAMLCCSMCLKSAIFHLNDRSQCLPFFVFQVRIRDRNLRSCAANVTESRTLVQGSFHFRASQDFLLALNPEHSILNF